MDPKEFKRQLLATFKAELDEHTASMNRWLLALEKKPSEDERGPLIADLFRGAHSIKGAARAVKVTDIETIAHRMEDVMGAIKGGRVSPTPEVVDLLLSGTDALGACMDAHLKGERMPQEARDGIVALLDDAIQNGTTVEDPPSSDPLPDTAVDDNPIVEDADAPPLSASPPPDDGQQTDPPPSAPTTDDPPAPETAVRASGETIRVSTAKLDKLMAVMGELLVARMRNEARLGEIDDIRALMEGWEKSWRKVRHRFRHLAKGTASQDGLDALMAFFSQNETYLNALSRKQDQWSRTFEKDCRHLSLITDDMQTVVRQVRMVPVGTLFDIFPRMVRDLSRAQGKAVTFEMRGTDTEIDRQVLEAMRDPLTHLLRNAVDHGIELPETRASMGKPKAGKLLLAAAHRGNSIVLEVSDDGAGIDLNAVRKAAEKSGMLLQKGAPALKPNETLDLIFHSGLSTMATVTDISGRGIGLDIVRNNLEQLHGVVDVNTTPKQGTTFTLSLPLTLATSHVLLMEVAGQTVAVPTNTVERILHFSPADVGSVDGRPAVTVNGRTLPLIEMAKVLELPPTEATALPDEKVPVVILKAAEKRMAYAVSRFLSTQEVVVKHLGRQLKRVRNVAGATILGTGQVVIILNVPALMKSARIAVPLSAPTAVAAGRGIKKRVLVVDDSITTRTLEKNILENAGYQVFVAADGMEGWETIQREALDAMIFDVDMPRMNGLELTEKVRGEKQLEGLPVVLVTSLDSKEHKIRGMEAGADAYITKGSFDQRELLETIERLVG